VSIELESFSPKLRAFLFYGHLKGKKSQKEIILSSILQKNNKKISTISAQASKKWLNQNNILVYKIATN
jgi:hypothetical protein